MADGEVEMSTVDNAKTILRFGDCTLTKLDKQFGLKQVRTSSILSGWLARVNELTDLERQILLLFQDRLERNGHDWNEQELSLHFIGPIFSLVDFTTDNFNLFAERYLSGTVGGIELRGEPDGMIASGQREPDKPYFCFQEYTPLFIPPDSGGTEGGDGDPAGQCLAAMLVAQELNETKYPVYGCYVAGYDWFFMVLQGKEYAVSTPFIAMRDGIFDIFRILRALRQIITELVSI